jgi:hypothetical protein
MLWPRNWAACSFGPLTWMISPESFATWGHIRSSKIGTFKLNKSTQIKAFEFFIYSIIVKHVSFDGVYA